MFHFTWIYHFSNMCHINLGGLTKCFTALNPSNELFYMPWIQQLSIWASLPQYSREIFQFPLSFSTRLTSADCWWRDCYSLSMVVPQWGQVGKKTFKRSEQMKKKSVKKKCRGDFTPFMSKSFQIWNHFFPILFPRKWGKTYQ